MKLNKPEVYQTDSKVERFCIQFANDVVHISHDAAVLSLISFGGSFGLVSKLFTQTDERLVDSRAFV
jgi:hypothetical protein